MVAYGGLHEPEIRTRESVVEPDRVIVIDSKLVHRSTFFSGRSPGGLSWSTRLGRSKNSVCPSGWRARCGATT